MRRVAVALVAVGLTVAPAAAELYRYVDENGKVHFVDSPGKVPASGGDLDEIEVGTDGGLPPPVQSVSPGDDRVSSGTVETRKRKARCKLVFKGRKVREDGQDTIYYGNVVNIGNGKAKGIRVTLTDYDARNKVLDRRSMSLTPSSLGPNELGTFEFKMKTSERNKVRTRAGFARSKFETSTVRCD